MKYTVEADPEVKAYLLFDKSLVKADFSAANRRGKQAQTLKQLQDDKKVVLIETDGAAGSVLNAYIEEPIPDRLQSLMLNSITVDPFVVESGKLHFTGAQIGPHHGELDIPGHGGSFRIPAGSYRVTVSQLEFNRKLMQASFAEQATASQRLVYNFLDSVMIIVGLVVLSCLISFFFLSWFAWSGVMLLIALPMFFIPSLYCKSRAFREGQKIWEKLDFPGFVAVFEHIPA